MKQIDCKNDNCDESFERTNLKKKFCSNKCRSQFNHKMNKIKYAKDLGNEKEYKLVRKYIVAAFEAEKYDIPIEYFDFAGVNLNSLKKLHIDMSGSRFYLVNDIRVYIGDRIVKLIIHKD
ncbi:hypothetical protein N9242_05150 [Vicingaceae bacterium]|nr:hypothetical protein [Vicingaceae bacterium]